MHYDKHCSPIEHIVAAMWFGVDFQLLSRYLFDFQVHQYAVAMAQYHYPKNWQYSYMKSELNLVWSKMKTTEQN